MALQTKINGRLVSGIVGEFSDNSPKTARQYIVMADSGKPTFGKFFSFSAGPLSTGTSTQTVFAKQGISTSTNTMGILVNPKEHFTFSGTDKGGFVTSLTINNGESATIATMGHIWVLSRTAVTAGTPVYINTDGDIGSLTGLGTATLVFGAKWLRDAAAYDTFSASSTYAVGDKVMYSNKAYVCKTAITTAAAWDATKWDATGIITEIAIANPLLKGEAGAGSL